MDLKTLQGLYKRCRDEPVEPNDDRFTNFEKGKPRGESWVSQLGNRVKLADGDPTWSLISGLPGSGKSTELRRLKQHLSRSGFLVVLVDAEDSLDLTQELDLTDIIAILVDAAERSVLAADGPTAGEARYLQRLWDWLTRTEVELKGFELSSGPLGLTFDLKANPSLRQQFRASATRQFGRFIEDAQEELRKLDTRAKKAGTQGLCLIFDSLEKLRGLTSNWKDVLESAERVFRTGAPHLKLPVHCIFTVPSALVFRLKVDVEFMPMVKLRGRDGARFEPGFAVMEEMVERRLGGNDKKRAKEMLLAILGPNYQQRLDRLIERSGGYARQLINVFIRLLELDEHPVSDYDLDLLDQRIREQFRAVVTTEMVPLLAKVAVDQNVEVPTETERPIVDQAIQNSLVLRYLNADVWFDLHPAVRDLPAVAKAVEELRRLRTENESSRSA